MNHLNSPMTFFLNDYWWVYLLRGALAVLLAILALIVPGIAFSGLILLLGGYLFLDGIFSFVAAAGASQDTDNWGWWLIPGICGTLLGFLIFSRPFMTISELVYTLVTWAFLAGLAEIIISIHLRKVIRGEKGYIIAGLLTLSFGLAILLNSRVPDLTLILVIYALAWGLLIIVLSLRLKKRYRILNSEEC